MGKLDYESISENPIVQRYQELKKSVKFYQQKCKEKEKGTEIQYDNEEKCIYFPIGPNNIGLKRENKNLNLTIWPTSGKIEPKKYSLDNSQKQIFLDVFTDRIQLGQASLEGRKYNMDKRKYGMALNIINEFMRRPDFIDNFNSK